MDLNECYTYDTYVVQFRFGFLKENIIKMKFEIHLSYTHVRSLNFSHISCV